MTLRTEQDMLKCLYCSSESHGEREFNGCSAALRAICWQLHLLIEDSNELHGPKPMASGLE